MRSIASTPRSPLTESLNVVLIRKYSCDELLSVWKRVCNFDARPDFHGLKEVFLYECGDTGIRFFHPDSIEGSSSFYERMQRANGYYYDHQKWEFQAALKRLPRNDRIIEVGSGNAVFIRMARAVHLDVTGLEINEEAVKSAKAKGLPIEAISVEQAARERRESYGAVCCFQVLEHIAKPRTTIESMLALLKPGGLLIVSVPNAAGYLGLYEDPWDIPPHHMTRWTPETFKAMEDCFPVRLEKMLLEPLSSVHVDTFLREYTKHYSLTHPPQRLLLNYTTLPFVRLLFKLGLRKWFPGHALLGVFRKTGRR